MNNIFKDLFIFEMANNHQGSIEHGIKIVKAMYEIAKKHDIHAGIKFQFRELKTFIHPEFRLSNTPKHIPRFLDTELAQKQFKRLIDEARQGGLLAICTPFDEISVDNCISQGIDIIKIASCSSTDWPLLEKISTAGLPIIASTGGLSPVGIDRLASFFSHRNCDFAIMHCVAEYPPPDENIQMNFLSRLIRRYPNIAIGYSGHESPDNLIPAQAAVAMGASILERHVGIPMPKTSLNKYSMNPEQVDKWVEEAMRCRIICGGRSFERTISDAEMSSLASLKRGVYAKKHLKKGRKLKIDDVFFAMPLQNGQLTSGDFGRKYATFKASHDYSANDPICEKCKPDLTLEIREYIHQAKGMLEEAGVVLNKDMSIELSHHYGLDKFRNYGAFIANIINRDYCKKIVIVFPGQKHPLHYHKRKEETFHVLWGELDLELNGIKHTLKAGDLILIERGANHKFTSKTGVIFEEISTKHFLNDSYYDDSKISSRDPIQRKTNIESW